MASKTKVYELAKQLGIGNQQMLEIAQRLGVDIKNSMSVLGSEEVRNICEYYEKNRALTKKVSTSPKGPVTEKRVGSKVIRRRAKPSTPSPSPAVSFVESPVAKDKTSAKESGKAKAKEPPPLPQAEKVGKAKEKPKAPAKPKPVIKRVQKEKVEVKKEEVRKKTKAKVKEAKKPAVKDEKVEEVEEVKQVEVVEPTEEKAVEQVVTPVEEKKRKAVPSIIKKIATEKHLSETVGPKRIVEKKAKVATTAEKDKEKEEAKATPGGFRRVKEITLSPMPTESQKEAGRRRLMRRQNTVFRSADYLKRELIHARKKKSTASRVALKTEITTPADHKRVVQMGETISVGELSHQMGTKATVVIKKLMDLGVTATINENIDFETAALVAPEYSYEVKQEMFREEDFKATVDLSEENLKPRAPVVTIMGHVDHGKTSLLDHIRKSKVAEGEAGGITQHIGAYIVKIPKKGRITFVDTPGHEAFTAMRARGAQVTDIVILVVSAVDGVMPQTLESVDHAKAAGVPIVVAINKMDLPDANPERVKQTLAGHELAPEDWGGDTIYVNVSAKTGSGIDDLLEAVLLQAEMMEIKANYSALASGIVVESRLDKSRGCIATIILRHGKLKSSDILVSGTTYGKVRAMSDCYGKQIKEAGPGDPVEILGLPEAAPVGDEVFGVKNEKDAKAITTERIDQARITEAEKRPKVSIEEMLAGDGDTKELRIILKSDVLGSVEAIKAAIAKLPNDKVKIEILRTAIGGITENDVNLAVASQAIIIGFNVRPDGKARKHAEAERIEIKSYRVIYELVDEIKGYMEGLLDKIIKETVIGHGEVRNVFNIPKIGAIAGSSVTDGKITRGCFMRLLRDSRVVYEGKVSSLRRFKEDVKEVASGYECGVGLENFNDLKSGDHLEAFVKEEEKATL